MFTATVVPRATAAAGECFGRHGFAGHRRRRIDDNGPHRDQEVIGRDVQIQTKEIGEVAMIAQPIRFEPIFEFFISVLAFASIGVVVVSGLWQDAGAGPIGDHRSAVRPLGIGFALDDHPALRRPRLGLIPESTEEPLWLASYFEPFYGCIQRAFAQSFQPGVHPQADRVMQAESLADIIHPWYAESAVTAEVELHTRPCLA